MLIAALAAILCCAALPGMAQTPIPTDYWFDGVFVQNGKPGAAGGELFSTEGIFGYKDTKVGTFQFKSDNPKEAYPSADGEQYLTDYQGWLILRPLDSTTKVLWEGKFSAPAGQTFFTTVVNANGDAIVVKEQEVAGRIFKEAKYSSVADFFVERVSGLWDAPVAKGASFNTFVDIYPDSIKGTMTGYVQFAVAVPPPPSIPEPVFFQFGAMMGLGGAGVLRLRRKA